jgi:hypothetical protein
VRLCPDEASVNQPHLWMNERERGRERERERDC